MDKHDLQQLLEEAEHYVDLAMASLLTRKQREQIVGASRTGFRHELELQEKLRATLLVNYLFPVVDSEDREILSAMVFVSEQIRMGCAVEASAFPPRGKKIFEKAMADLESVYMRGEAHIRAMELTPTQRAIIGRLMTIA